MKIDPRHISFADLVIRTQVKWLRERGVIRRSEVEDFASDLMAQLLEAWDGFDPERGTREAFINQVVSTRILSLLRDRRAQKRRGNPLPLDADGDSVADPACAGDTWIRTIDLRVDIESARSKLTPKQQAVCDQLLRDVVSPAAKEMGVPRSTLRYAVTKIRQIFRDAGLEEYL